MSALALEGSARIWNEAASGQVAVEVGTGAIIGCGEDMLAVLRETRQALEDHFAPASRQLESAREQIDRLAAEWKAATMFVSSTTQMCTHPAYQRIIGMGPEAIPLLLERLDQKPDHWFWALHAITGVNPTGPADAGDIERMSDAWLRWGREHGYIS